MTTTVHPAGSAPAPAPEAANPAKAKRDPRYLALRNFAISLTIFNTLGYTVLGFEQPWLWPFLALATGYTTELVLETIGAWAERRAPRFRGNGPRGLYEFLLPAHITSLAANMLLYANDQWWPIMFAVVVAVGQKHVLKAPVAGRWRHFMNPSNFGITMTLLLFGTWVSIAPPYQFTEYANNLFRILIPLVIATAGTVINAVLTRRVMLIMGWMGGFAIQALVRHWIWHVALFSALGAMSGVAFVLFTNYMITDPGTTPSKPRSQFVFGAGIATVYAVLMVCNVTYTLFYATTIVCGLRGLGWWAAHLRRRRAEAATGPLPGARPGGPAA
ncbi:enediyne biosynthesis protein [Actinoallomurus sp. NPDC050550]|uniref:enediyne biosynthesis protein n=1 Tax=Actinoallomurus sp. NPDC050550 TaxID=3154937 RepID=UPI0033C4E602